MIGWVGFAGAVGFILVTGWAFVCDFDEWWHGHERARSDERCDEDPEPTWVAETLAEIDRLPEVAWR